VLSLIYLILITSIALILIGILSLPNLNKRRIVLPKEEKQTKGLIKHISFLSPISNRFLEKLKLDVKIKNKLDAAHINFTAQQFFSLKLALILLAGILAFFFIKKSDPLVLIGGIFVGYIIPDIWLSSKISQRRYAVARVLPETVDLLGLCVEAGLDFTTAVKWIIEKKVFTNPMIEELTLVLEEIKWGKPRGQSLKDMAKRLNLPEVSSFVQALVQAERMGTPVSETFAIISEDTRLQRYRRGEKYALQAPIKILLPLIFCILPVIGIIIGGPILLQFTKGGLLTGLGK
jgi:pilus assembly protein TadC